MDLLLSCQFVLTHLYTHGYCLHIFPTCTSSPCSCTLFLANLDLLILYLFLFYLPSSLLSIQSVLCVLALDSALVQSKVYGLKWSSLGSTAKSKKFKRHLPNLHLDCCLLGGLYWPTAQSHGLMLYYNQVFTVFFLATDPHNASIIWSD